MSEAAPENTPQPAPDGSQTDTTPAAPSDGQQSAETFDKAYVEQLRREAAKYRTEAKKASDAAEALRKSQMSEAEKAIAEAKQAGRAEAATEYGTRLARTELKAAAAAKQVDLAEVLEDLDLTRYVGDDGEPDLKRIQATVDRFASLASPKQAQSFDGGVRQTAKTTDMNELIRAQVGIRAS